VSVGTTIAPMPKEVMVAIATAKPGLKGVEAARAPLNAARRKEILVSWYDHEKLKMGDGGHTHYCGGGT